MPLTPFLIGFFIFAAFCAMFACANFFGARRRWRERRRFAAGHSTLWGVVFALLAVLGAFAGSALLGYRRLTTETTVATLDTRKIGEQRYAVRIEYPDGTRRSVDLAGDQWQLDARVIKWKPTAVVLGAPSLYRLDRISGRYANATQESERQRSAIALGEANPFNLDLLDLKQRFPQWMGWVDADYGSAAYLPLLDGARFRVTLAPAGGLVARPADAASEQKLHAAGW